MTWVRIDDGAPEHPKQIAVGAPAAWLWVCGLCYCNRQKKSTGFIPAAKVPLLYPFARPGAEALAEKLVEAGLWEKAAGGYQIHDYGEYQPKADVDLSAKRAEAGRVGGQRSGEARRKQVASPIEASNEANAEATIEAPAKPPVEAPSRSHPIPSNTSPSSSSISSLISQSSLVSAPSQPRAREDFDPADKAVRLVLARRDLWPAEYVTDAEIVAVVSRCRAAWRDEPAAKRLGLTLEHALREAINDAQMFGKRYTSATPEQLLARIEQRVEWILGECRSGRRKATVAATESDVAEDAQDSADAILARQEADRRRSEAERAKTRAFANDPAAKAKREADLARLARAAAPEQFSKKGAGGDR